MEGERLERHGGFLCGVCEGIAEYLECDPTVLRIAVVALSFVSGLIPLLIVYLTVALIMPKR